VTARPNRRFSFALAEHPLLTPLLANVAVPASSRNTSAIVARPPTRFADRAAIAGHAALEFSDIYAGDQPGFAVASAVAMPLAALLTNALEPCASNRCNSRLRAPSGFGAPRSSACGSTRRT